MTRFAGALDSSDAARTMVVPNEPAASHARAPSAIEWLVVTVLSLVALVILRRADLASPFYWDAAAVYAPGARWVAEHHFAAVPGVFPSLLGRGHTTLFYVVTAAAFRIMGAGPVAGHIPVLLFGAAALVFTYALGTWLFGRPAGIAAAALLCASPLFLTMSSETLPEVPITALAVASLYAYARGRIGVAAAVGTALVLTKETGIAGPLAIVGAMLWECWRTGSMRSQWRTIAVASVPVGALAVFFVWQRIAEGWWVLPYHAELFHAEHSLVGQGIYTLRTIVWENGRGIALGAAVVVLVFRAATGRTVWPAEPAGDGSPRASVLMAIGLVVAANVVFFAKMFFIERYALPAHPGVVVAIAGALFGERMRPRWIALGAIVTSLAVGMGLRDRDGGTGFQSGETTFRYLRAVRTRRWVYQALDARPRAPVVLTGWPMNDELRDPFLGWVQRSYSVMSVGYYREHGRRGPDGHAIDAVLIANGLDHERALREEALRLGFHRTLREAQGDAWAELWEP